jgi:hypothetical protein
VSKEQLSNLIEKKRAELIEIVMKEGFDSPDTILYSQELDRLLNQYNRIYIQHGVSNYTLKSKTS